MPRRISKKNYQRILQGNLRYIQRYEVSLKKSLKEFKSMVLPKQLLNRLYRTFSDVSDD